MPAGNEPHVSGALACGLRDVVAELAGAAVVERALTRVSAEVQSSYQHATAIGWVPIRVLETVFDAIAYETGTTVSELHTRVARTSIDRTFRTFWRVLLRMTTDHALVARTPSIFARSYDRGRLEAKISQPGRGVITLFDWPDVPDWPLRATRIGIETVLTIAGRRDVRVNFARTATGATFLASWH